MIRSHPIVDNFRIVSLLPVVALLLLGMLVACNQSVVTTQSAAETLSSALNVKINASIFLTKTTSPSAEVYPVSVVATGSSAKYTFKIVTAADHTRPLVVSNADLGTTLSAAIVLPTGFDLNRAIKNQDMLHYSVALPKGSVIDSLESYEPFPTGAVALADEVATIDIAKTEAYVYLIKLGIIINLAENASIVSTVIDLFTQSQITFEATLSQNGSTTVLISQVLSGFQDVLQNDSTFKSSLTTAVASKVYRSGLRFHV